jgi:hypothetical protein
VVWSSPFVQNLTRAFFPRYFFIHHCCFVTVFFVCFQIGLLSSLVVLELPRNALNGPLPPQLAALGGSLRKLDLRDNALSGPLDGDLLAALGKALTHLCLAWNHVRSISGRGTLAAPAHVPTSAHTFVPLVSPNLWLASF